MEKYTGSAIAEEFEETESVETTKGAVGKPTEEKISEEQPWIPKVANNRKYKEIMNDVLTEFSVKTD